jgi:hypothetical protein
MIKIKGISGADDQISEWALVSLLLLFLFIGGFLSWVFIFPLTNSSQVEMTHQSQVNEHQCEAKLNDCMDVRAAFQEVVEAQVNATKSLCPIKVKQ